MNTTFKNDRPFTKSEIKTLVVFFTIVLAVSWAILEFTGKF